MWASAVDLAEAVDAHPHARPLSQEKRGVGGRSAHEARERCDAARVGGASREERPEWWTAGGDEPRAHGQWLAR